MKKFFLPEILFIIFSILFGIFLIILTPPLQSADETGHFAKVMGIIQGDFAPVIQDKKEAGNYLPRGVLEFQKEYESLFHSNYIKTSFKKINETKKIKPDKIKKEFVKERYIAMYSPFGYLPQALGAFIGKKVFNSIYYILIGAKLTLLLFYTILGYFTIKSIPFLKWVCFLILLTPMSLSLGASVSCDAVLISISFLYFAKIMQFSYQDKVLSKKDILILSVLAIFLGMVKQSFLITLFILFIPKEKFGSDYFKKLALILLPSFICSTLWTIFAYQFFIPMKNSNPTEQMKFILQNPLIYMQILFSTLSKQFNLLTYSFIGLLGWFNVGMSAPKLYLVYWAVLFLNSFNFEEKTFKTDLYQRFILFFVLTLDFLLICTAIYTSWNAPYYVGIFEGLQGRYFIPISLPFFAVIFLLNKLKFFSMKSSLIIINSISVIAIHISMLLGIFDRYY